MPARSWSLTFVKAARALGRKRATVNHPPEAILSAQRKPSGLRDLFVRLVILLPLLQAFAPTAAAFNPSEDVWCRSVASQTSKEWPVNKDEGQCLVCIAFAIGANSSPASAPVHVIPSPVVAGLLNPPLR